MTFIDICLNIVVGCLAVLYVLAVIGMVVYTFQCAKKTKKN